MSKKLTPIRFDEESKNHISQIQKAKQMNASDAVRFALKTCAQSLNGIDMDLINAKLAELEVIRKELQHARRQQPFTNV